MPDTLGLLQVPAVTVLTGEAAGDPALSRLLAFLKSFINDNATTAWQQVVPSGGAYPTPVIGTVVDQLNEGAFNDRLLPALFAWRDAPRGEQFERAGDDLYLVRSRVSLLWLWPWSPQDIHAVRAPFIHTLQSLIPIGIERGRTPGYVLAGDPDTRSATQGTLLGYAMQFWTLFASSSQRATVTLKKFPKADPREYLGFQYELDLVEKVTLDNTRGTDALVSPAVDITETNSSGGTTNHARF